MLESDWQVFIGRIYPDCDVPRVSLLKRGMIGLNKKALDALDKPDRVVFLYNKKQHAIGIRPARNGEWQSYRVRQTKIGTGSIVAQAFFKHIGLILDQPMRLIPTEHLTSLGIMLVVQLDEQEGKEQSS